MPQRKFPGSLSTSELELMPWSSEEVLETFDELNTKELEKRAEVKKAYYDFKTEYVISYAHTTKKLLSAVSYWYVYKLQRLGNGSLELVPVAPPQS